MHDVHALKERKLIILNSQNQHVGPTDVVVIELSSFIESLARNKMSKPNSKNRKKFMNPQTASKESFALVPNKLAEMEEIENQISINENARKDTENGDRNEGTKENCETRIIAYVIAQLKHAGLIDPQILSALSTSSPREITSVQGAEQGKGQD
ncbi:hypothetical protein EJD97_021203 [Solanum chilense]|uniref:Uncharacterized protein n=1 Tax=Solanum chilense TaxID=4083 RepID=A0A6N2AY94_SOLCI|nr:hypothetical protein EJD97_021203 [Solanum chilense]